MLEDTSISTMLDTVLIRTPTHRYSHTLYAGLTDEPVARESGILIKFASVDTSQLADLQAAKLVLFRRTFADEPPELETNFDLYVIDEPDTAWAESDTGLTLTDFPNLVFHADSSMIIDTVAVLVGDTVLEHLAFPVDTLLLRQWAGGSMANNGFLIRQESGGALVGFYSWESYDLSPYLALTIADTTSTGADTTIIYYDPPTEDLSIYPSLPDNSIYSDSLLHLDYSSGVRSHVDFAPYFDPDTTSIIAGARLVLHVNHGASQILADRVDLQVLRRAKPLAQGDSTEVLISSVIYQKGSDNLVLKLGGFLSSVIAGVYENFGLDLVVIPSNHDFDHLVFWGASAPDSLKRPRLEIIYSSLYKEVP